MEVWIEEKYYEGEKYKIYDPATKEYLIELPITQCRFNELRDMGFNTIRNILAADRIYKSDCKT